MIPDFSKGGGLLPVIIQDAQTMQVLMLGYMNEDAYATTLKEGFITFFSRSKQRLWMKGETTGNKLKVVEILNDCDNDTLLIKAIPYGPVCHTGDVTCFEPRSSKGFLYRLEAIIQERIAGNIESSYSNTLYRKGVNKVAQKVGEEAVELVIEAMDSNIELFKNEAADLMYHVLLLLKSKNVALEDIETVLMTR
jgi:phosphoribosyl-ATP pyrophosphohydrolase/phosphoribosyl-AMP cyclohydrolase